MLWHPHRSCMLAIRADKFSTIMLNQGTLITIFWLWLRQIKATVMVPFTASVTSYHCLLLIIGLPTNTIQQTSPFQSLLENQIQSDTNHSILQTYKFSHTRQIPQGQYHNIASGAEHTFKIPSNYTKISRPKALQQFPDRKILFAEYKSKIAELTANSFDTETDSPPPSAIKAVTSSKSAAPSSPITCNTKKMNLVEAPRNQTVLLRADVPQTCVHWHNGCCRPLTMVE